MSLAKFERRIVRMDLSDGDREWFPKWLAGYAEYGRCDPARRLPIAEDRVIGFLRSLRDSHVAAWRRLQAARAMETYQALVLRSEQVAFHPIKLKLHEIARREKFADGPLLDDESPVAGEGNDGLLDEREPDVVRQMRGRLRVLHHPKSTDDLHARDESTGAECDQPAGPDGGELKN